MKLPFSQAVRQADLQNQKQQQLARGSVPPRRWAYEIDFQKGAIRRRMLETIEIRP